MNTKTLSFLLALWPMAAVPDAPPIDPAELAAPQVAVVDGNVEFTIPQSVSGRRYQLQQSETMESGSWIDVGEQARGNGGALVMSFPHEPAVHKRFYRLALDPVPPIPEDFVLIPAGEFIMGRTGDDTDSDAPPVNVHVSGFYMAKYEVTKELWDEVRAWGLGSGYTDLPAGGGKDENHPVHSVNWWQAVKWCNARSEMEGLPPCYRLALTEEVYRIGAGQFVICDWSVNGYRLPTEAEWEKAARGGVSGLRFPWGDEINHDHANYQANGSSFIYDTSPHATWTYHPDYATSPLPYTSPVGSFAPNGHGLHDMIGNVWEWCWDYYSESAYTDGASDPKGPYWSDSLVLRGGSWGFSAFYCRSAYRIKTTPYDIGSNIGFRVARVR